MIKTLSQEEFQKIIAKRLSVRAQGVLARLKVKNPFDLRRLSSVDILKVRNCGKNTFEEIETLRLELWPRNNKPQKIVKAQNPPKRLKNSQQYWDLIRELSPQAKNILARLGVRDSSALRRLSPRDIMQTKTCGIKTFNEIEAFRSKLWSPQNLQQGKAQTPNSTELPEGSPDFEILKRDLSIRAQNVLEKLGVEDVDSLVKLTTTQLLGTRNCGRKTHNEIAALISTLCPQTEENIKQESINEIDYEGVPNEVFEAVKSVLSVRGNNVLKGMNIKSFKSFMRIERRQLLDTHHCGRKTADEIQRIQASICEYARSLANNSSDFHPRQLLAAPCLANTSSSRIDSVYSQYAKIDINNPAPWLAGWIHGLTRTKTQALAFMLRKGMLGNTPMTLELVGEQLGALTRERIRQLEMAVDKKISITYQQNKLLPLFDTAVAIVHQRGGMIGLDELTKVLLCKGENGDQLRNATALLSFFSTLQAWKESGLLLQKGGIVKTEGYHSLIFHLANEIEKVVSCVADEQNSADLWSVDRNQLKKVLLKRIAATAEYQKLECISDALLDTALRQCTERVKVHKGRIYSVKLWLLRYGKILEMLDIVLSQIGKPTHFTEIAKEVRKWRPNFSDRNTYASLARVDNALLWDRGTFVHKDNVSVPYSLIHDIERWLLQVLKKDVPYVSAYGAFLHFRSRCKAAGLPSEYAIYTCLRRSAQKNLVFPRCPYVYLRTKYTEHIPAVIVFEDFIRDQGGPVSLQEAREFGIKKIFLKEFQFSQLSAQVSNVIRTVDWGYIHLDNTQLSRKSILPLIEHTHKVLSKEKHCTIDKIYNEKQVTCRSIGIDNSLMLYSVFQCFAEDQFSLDGHSLITRFSAGEQNIKHTFREHIINFIRDQKGPCTYEALEKRFIEKLKYKEQSVYSIVRDAEICVYHPGCVIHHQTIAWDKAKQQALENEALKYFINAVKAGMRFGRVSHLVESNDLPSLPPGLYWSKSMIADLLAKGGNYLILGNAREAFVPRDSENYTNSFEVVIAKMLDKDWGGAANLIEFEKALLGIGIIKKHLTSSMLGSGEHVVIREGEIILKELLVDAQRP